MNELRVLDLFSGIGGFSLGLERTGGFRTVAFCEIEPFCQRVLRKHWPDVPIYDDVRELTAERLRADGIAVDVVTGGFPCQDISVAGRRAGIEGERSGLWTDLCRIIGDIRPRYAIVENVSNLLSGPSEQRGGWFGRVLGDLAKIGYDAEWHCISASAVGAPHIRDRVWVVAYPAQLFVNGGKCKPEAGHSQISESGNGGCTDNVADVGCKHGGIQRTTDVECEPEQGSPCSGRDQKIKTWQESRMGRTDTLADPRCRRRAGQGQPIQSCNQASSRIGQAIELVNGGIGEVWCAEPDVGRVAHGVPSRVDRLRGLGNAVVPQIPELIGRAILEAEGR